MTDGWAGNCRQTLEYRLQLLSTEGTVLGPPLLLETSPLPFWYLQGRFLYNTIELVVGVAASGHLILPQVRRESRGGWRVNTLTADFSTGGWPNQTTREVV